MVTNDEDITDEIRRREKLTGEEYNGRIEVWDWENGVIEIYLEEF